MRFKLMMFLSVFLFSAQWAKTQNYYEHYQDGLVVFQLKLQSKKMLSKDKQVNFKDYPLFTEYLSDFEIVEVKHLHPELDDDLLNRTYQISLSDFSKVDEVIRKLSAHPTIEYAELKELHHTFLTPNDPYFGNQYQYGLIKIQAQQAWNLSTGSSNVVVAVTDNAINVDHPDLQNIVVGGYDAVDQDNDPRPCGSNDGLHGSHVSGTVGCETNNNTGLASIGFGISVMPIKIGTCTGSLTAGYDGIVYAANNGADVINMSWGGPGSSNYGQNVINNAWNAGSILVAASGNDNVSTLFYPAGYNNVVTVASTDQNDNKSSFSNYGNWIDISAPGTGIYSTNEGNSYVSLSGTSMASPLVSGLLGLMKSYAPSASNADLVSCLYSSADDISAQNSGYIGQLGNGRINAFAALSCLTSHNVQYDASINSITSPKGLVCSNAFIPKIELKNNGSTTLTSATITYDWGGPIRTFNWSGSLSSGQSVVVTLPSETEIDGTYVFSATVTSPNGQTDLNPANNNLTSNFTINSSGDLVTLNLNTDCWGAETTWEITDGNNVVVASGGPYTNVAGGTTNTYNLCLPKACYKFTIFDGYGDGMSGAQYQNCSTNGNYEMRDGNGNVLFNMTAQNGNFGSSANHPFCLQSNITDDAGITNITSPVGIICSSSVQPIVRLQNFGTSALTSVTINYQTSGGVQTFAWTGNLTSNQSQLVTLPAIATANGQQTITVYTTNPNGNTDGNAANDQAQSGINIQNTSSSLPFVEDFESNVFVNGKWSVVNPDNSTTWERVSVAGSTPGSNAAKIDFFNYQQSGRRDGMISPKINLTSVSSAHMTFDHAYRRFNQNAADSLIIYVSIDCGVNWSRVFAKAENGTGSFATQTTNTAEFTPLTAADWCFGGSVGATCFTVNLDPFVGNDVFVKFESYNAGPIGNNLYLDNINIDGVAVQLAPEPGLSASSSVVCEGETVYYTDQSTNQPTSWNWTFPGGSPSTSTLQNPVVTYPTSGTYDVTLQASNAYGTQTMTFSNQITVNGLPQVNATAVDMTICSGASTSISASGASSYSWNNGLGGGSTHTVSPTTTTTYQVTGTSGNCSNTASVEVVVSPPINVGVTASATEVCAGSSVSLSASGASTYTWNNGLGSGNTQTDSPTQTKVYTVTGTEGNCSNSASITIVVNDVPVVQVSAINTTICEGENTTMNASGADTYAWTPSGSLNTSSGASVVASPSATTTYSVMGSNNCGIDTETIVINVNASPGQPTISQVGNVLSTNLQTGETAQWFLNGALVGSGASITMTQDGNYEVVITNANGCSASANGNFVRDTTGLTQNELNKHLKVYPNPTENTVHVSWEGAELIEKIVVYDAIGRAVIKLTDVNDKTEMLDFTSFETGVYIVRIETASNTISRKITKR